MATYVSFKKFITLPRVIRAFKSVSDIFRAVKGRPAYSRSAPLTGVSRVAGQVDVTGTIRGRSTLALLRKNGRKP